MVRGFPIAETDMTPQTRRALNLLSLTMFSVGAAMFVAIGTLPDIAPSLGVTRAQAGLVIAVYAFGSAIGAPLLQVLLGHLPRKRLIVGGLGVLGAGMVVSGLAPTLEMALAGRVLSAIGGALASPMASALGAELVSTKRQGQALAMIFGGMTVASAVVAPLATWMGAHLGWRMTFVAFGLAILAVAALTAWRVPETGRGERLPGRALVATLLRGPTLAGLTVSVVMIAGLFTTFSMITVIYFEHIGASPEATSFAMLLYGIAGIAGNFAARVVMRFWPPERTQAVGLVVVFTAFMSLYLMPPLMVPATAAVVLWSTMLALLMPAQQQRMIGLEPNRVGLVLALNASSIYVGMSVGSWIAGRVDASWGLASLPLVSASLIALALGLLAGSVLLARRRLRFAPAE